MTPPTADRWCCRTVELAARVLPAEHRQRYALEFIAELYGMSRPQQVSHSVQVLSRAWALRAALDAAALGPIPERARHRTRGWLLCHLGRHLWALHRNPDVGGKDAVFELCRRCGRERQGTRHPRRDRFWAASRPRGPPGLRSWRRPRTSYERRGGVEWLPDFRIGLPGYVSLLP